MRCLVDAFGRREAFAGYAVLVMRRQAQNVGIVAASKQTHSFLQDRRRLPCLCCIGSSLLVNRLVMLCHR
jgi:hypothetical protein